MFILGIVGTPAGGKTTVASYLADRGATWIDADRIAREILERDEVQAELISHFGRQLLGKDGRIDRTKLAAEVFGDDGTKHSALTYLESVIHPPTRDQIRQRLREAADAGSLLAILDVPLLFESDWDVCCDAIWCIDSPWPQRLNRSAQRGWNAAELRRREANQWDISRKRRLSNLSINNDSSLDRLYESVEQQFAQLLHRIHHTKSSKSLATAGSHCETDR